MLNFEKVVEYFGEQGKMSSLPTFDQFVGGFERASKDRDMKPVDTLRIAEDSSRTRNQIFQIASYLWGRNHAATPQFSDAKILSIEQIRYADNKPIRVRLELPSEILTFYAKPFDERRMFGLELESRLSQDPYNFVLGSKSIFEAERPGIEADDFEEGRQYLSLPEYLKELVRLDERCKVMLMGDMHKSNYIVQRIEAETGMRYEIRVIDPEKLFDVGDVEYAVLNPERLRAIEKKIGKQIIADARELERARMRNRFYENEKQLTKLFKLMGDSDECNKALIKSEVPKMLTLYHKDGDFYRAKHAGSLLEMHMRKVLRL